MTRSCISEADNNLRKFWMFISQYEKSNLQLSNRLGEVSQSPRQLYPPHLRRDSHSRGVNTTCFVYRLLTVSHRSCMDRRKQPLCWIRPNVRPELGYPTVRGALRTRVLLIRCPAHFDGRPFFNEPRTAIRGPTLGGRRPLPFA